MIEKTNKQNALVSTIKNFWSTSKHLAKNFWISCGLGGRAGHLPTGTLRIHRQDTEAKVAPDTYIRACVNARFHLDIDKSAA